MATIEAELAALKRKVEQPDPPRDWRKTIGMFTSDEGMKEMFRDALKLREADRSKARRARRPNRKAQG